MTRKDPGDKDQARHPDKIMSGVVWVVSRGGGSGGGGGKRKKVGKRETRKARFYRLNLPGRGALRRG